MTFFFLGATAMASAVAGLLFLRLWRESRDRLYAMFACAFWLEALARATMLLAERPSEGHPALYLLRIGAYGLILMAIADKNIKWR